MVIMWLGRDMVVVCLSPLVRWTGTVFRGLALNLKSLKKLFIYIRIFILRIQLINVCTSES